MPNISTIRKQCAQLISIGIEGKSLTHEEKSWLAKDWVGGVTLFHRNIESLEQVIALNKEIFSCASLDHPVIMSVDQEGGRVARLRGIMTDTPPMGLLQRNVQQNILNLRKEDEPKANEEFWRKLGALMGRELTALGFHMNFAPILDVNSNRNNPVIGQRSFHHDPKIVARIGAAFIRGQQSSGVAAVGKHFPGHGDTSSDSHFELPKVDHPLSRLKEVEWPPFQSAIEAGVAAMMTAHLIAPHLDSNIATVSKTILQTHLRESLGFEGCIISDDLGMKALSNTYSLEESACLAIAAGVDHLLVCNPPYNLESILDALVRAVENGDIAQERFHEALNRNNTLKKRYVGAPAAPDLAQARTICRNDVHLRLLAEATRVDLRNPEERRSQNSPDISPVYDT